MKMVSFCKKEVNNKMQNEHIDNAKQEQLSFGQIIQRERKKLGKSLKDIERDMTVDGTPLITSSYLNRIENANRENISFPIVLKLIQAFNLDFNEVLKSFGYENVLPNSTKYNNIDTMVRVNDLIAPIGLNSRQGQEHLRSTEKEIIIRLIDDIFEFGATSEDNTMYTLRKIIDGLDDYRKSRIKIAKETMSEDTTN